MTTKGQRDVRGDANLLEAVAAVKLVLASRDYSGNQTRCLDMINWLLEREDPRPSNDANLPVALFIEAIRVTKR